MKKSSAELTNELNAYLKELHEIKRVYPTYIRSKPYIKLNTSIPQDIKERRDYLEKRINNLHININQMKMKEMNTKKGNIKHETQSNYY
jgi:hypothetical protein